MFMTYILYSILFKIKDFFRVLSSFSHHIKSHTVNIVDDVEALCKYPASHPAKQLIYSGDNNKPVLQTDNDPVHDTDIFKTR